jgi:hypothetical protein
MAHIEGNMGHGAAGSLEADGADHRLHGSASGANGPGPTSSVSSSIATTADIYVSDGTGGGRKAGRRDLPRCLEPRFGGRLRETGKSWGNQGGRATGPLLVAQVTGTECPAGSSGRGRI